MSALTFNATTVTPAGDRSALPKGRYPVMVIASDIKPGKAATDRKAELTLKVLDGPCKDRIFSRTINFMHSNPVAQQIGQEQLSALCHAAGVLQITDTTQLHGRPFQVDLEVQAEDSRYNEITAWYRADGTPVGAGMATGAPAAAQAPAWAQGQQPAAPAPAPMAPPAPAPAPAPAPIPAPAPAPAAPVVPAAPPVQEKLYYVAVGGQNVTPQPIPASQVLAMPQGLANLQLCEVGTNAWLPGTTLANAAPAPAANTAALPPWMTAPAQ